MYVNGNIHVIVYSIVQKNYAKEKKNFKLRKCAKLNVYIEISNQNDNF